MANLIVAFCSREVREHLALSHVYKRQLATG